MYGGGVRNGTVALPSINKATREGETPLFLAGPLDLMGITSGALPRLAALAVAWAAFGFLTGAQQCVVASWMTAHNAGSGSLGGAATAGAARAAKWHLLCHAVGVVLLAAGGAVVRGDGGGYVPCPGNVTMDLPCMLHGQSAAYLAPYVLHFVGGSYFVAGWLLDGCHLAPWAFSMAQFAVRAPHELREEADEGAARTTTTSTKLKQPAVYPLTIFLTPQAARAERVSIPFESRWHLLAKAALSLLIIVTWTTGAVEWSTEPELSKAAYGRDFVSLGGLLLIFAAEVACVFAVVSAGLRWGRGSC